MASDRYALFGGKLGSVCPATTAAQTVFTALATTEITRVQICNLTNNSVQYYLYHDDTGSSYGTASALVWNKTITGYQTEVIEAQSQGSGITIKRGGTLAFQNSATSHLNCTVYGIVQMAR